MLAAIHRDTAKYSTMTKYKLLIYLTVIFFASCNDTKKESEKSKYEIRWDKQEQLDTLNQNEAFILSKKFHAITGKDSTIKFTYQIQELAKRYNKPISFTGNINDIMLQDSNYVLKIYGRFGKKECFANIFVSPQQFYELNKQLDLKSSRNKACFIFNPTSIKTSSMLTIDSELSTDDNAETVEDANANASSELTYDFHEALLFLKGNLIDFYVYKKLPEDND